MRLFNATLVVSLAAGLAAAPAFAAPQPAPRPAPIAVPPELSDPALPDKLGRMSGALTRAVMDMPVGELEAAIENRPVTPADKARRVRDVAARGDPNVERRIAAETAASGRAMQGMTKALVASIPAILASLGNVQVELEKAVANLPDPTYPRR
ncbi:MAG: hypothetical protein ABIR51_01145 [Sphingomicrobium sp.]